MMLFGTFPLTLGLWFVHALGYNMSVAVAVGFIALAGVAAEEDVAGAEVERAPALQRHGLRDREASGFGVMHVDAKDNIIDFVEKPADPPAMPGKPDIALVSMGVYVFNRGKHPMIVFDADGNFIKSWGEGTYPRAHGLHIDADDNLYCTDDGDHTVRKCTTDGKVQLTIGIPNKPAPFMSGEPFRRCTHTALSPRGDIYVSDGYGNARVHKYSPDGKLIKSWGEPGCDPAEDDQQARPELVDQPALDIGQ